MKLTTATSNRLAVKQSLLNAAFFYYKVRGMGGIFSTKIRESQLSQTGFTAYQCKRYLTTLVNEGWVRSDNNGVYFFQSTKTIGSKYCNWHSCQAADVPPEALESLKDFKGFVCAIVMGGIAKSLAWGLNQAARLKGERVSTARLAVSLPIIEKRLNITHGSAMRLRQGADASGFVTVTASVTPITDDQGNPIAIDYANLPVYKQGLPSSRAKKIVMVSGVVCQQCSSVVGVPSGLLRRTNLR